MFHFIDYINIFTVIRVVLQNKLRHGTSARKSLSRLPCQVLLKKASVKLEEEILGIPSVPKTTELAVSNQIYSPNPERIFQ